VREPIVLRFTRNLVDAMDPATWKSVKEAFGRWMDLPPERRADFLGSLDEEIRAEVERLAANFEPAAGFIEEPAVLNIDGGAEVVDETDPHIGEQIDNYRIASRIGIGGMGAVYLAEHLADGVTHRVALKLVKRGMDTSVLLKRFLRERQILAALEHPNIARFLDGGSTQAGVPYFVMEFVEGLSITRYCDANGLGIERRIELFRKVCSAVSFAHANLTVHRDLKPSNILIDGHGEPKLLDFGIAKLLHPDWSAESREGTATGFQALTPEYASPEQLRGETITTSTDVYSLGVVLYELLTGRRPFGVGSLLPMDAALKVSSTDPPKPSAVAATGSRPAATDSNKWRTAAASISTAGRAASVSRTLRGDLDNIILKALEKEPSRRYASVVEFSEDLSRYLDGLPVKASAPTLRYRLRKFLGRNTVASAAVAASIVVLLGATAVTAWQARQAAVARTAAQERFGQVRRLANLVIFDYHDAISKLSGSTAVRAKMLSDALVYLDGLSAERSGDSDLMREVAAAYEKIGGVQGGDESLGILGRTDAAAESYRKALQIRESLVAASPENVDDMFALAVAYRNVGDVIGAQGDFPGRLANYEKAIELHERVIKLQPSRVEFADGLAAAYYDLGYGLDQAGDAAKAEPAYMRAIDVWTTAPAKPKGGLLSKAHKFLGSLRDRRGQHSEARANFQESLNLDLANLEADPLNMQARLDLSTSYINFANSLIRTKEFAEAAAYCAKSLEIRRKVAAEDPANVRAVTFLARALDTAGQIAAGQGQNAEATDLFAQAIEVFEHPGMQDPKEILSRNLLANFYKNLADAQSALASTSENGPERRKHLERARQNYTRAIEISTMLREKNAMTPQNQADPEKLRARLSEIAELQQGH
jgi:serine/threonine protein kinase/tetratricopeptide (TPR) repeat protein